MKEWKSLNLKSHKVTNYLFPFLLPKVEMISYY